MKKKDQIKILKRPIEELINWQNKCAQIQMINWKKELEKESDLICRFNRININIKTNEYAIEDFILITVRRTNSKIRIDNFYTVPIYVPELKITDFGKYTFLSFDSFNLPFDDLMIEITKIEDYKKREISDRYLERSKKYTKKIKEKDD